MLFVSSIINMLMWAGYLIGAFIMLWAFIPVWGGWRSLNREGKAIAVSGAVMCLVCGYNLITTTVIPF